jgi:hypothetical protein
VDSSRLLAHYVDKEDNPRLQGYVQIHIILYYIVGAEGKVHVQAIPGGGGAEKG